MIEVGNWVLVKSKDSFPGAIVLEIAKNDDGKRIYRVAHSLKVAESSDSQGYWIDGSKVFETDEQPQPEDVSNNAPITTEGPTLLKRVQ